MAVSLAGWMAVVLASLGAAPQPPTPGDNPVSPSAARPRAAAVLELAGAPPERTAACYAALLSAGYPPVEPADRLGLSGPPDPPVLDVDSARAALLSARGHFKQLELEAARTDAETGLELLEEAPHLAQQRPLFANLHLLLAEIALGEGREGEANRHLDLALRLEPERVLHPGLYPPPVLQAWSARQAAVAPGTGVLSVVVEPADAHLLLDGVALARDAAGSAVVRAGEHYVMAARPDGASRARRVVVPEHGMATLHLFVPPLGGARARAALRTLPPEEAARQALDLLPATVVVALAPDGSAAVALVRAHSAVELLPPGDLARQLPEVLQRLETPAPVTPVPEDAPPPRRLPWLTGGILGALAGAAGLPLVLALPGVLLGGMSTSALVAILAYQDLTRPAPHAKGRVVLGGGEE